MDTYTTAIIIVDIVLIVVVVWYTVHTYKAGK